MDLVQYDSDGSNDASERATSIKAVTAAPSLSLSQAEGGAPPAKRRKVLPSLPSAYSVQSGDDPSKHQGRTRSRPFVEGEYNAHLFLSLPVSRALGKVINDILDAAKQACPGHTLHSNLAPQPQPEATNNQKKRAERYLPLHVSLTHPLPLRRSQIDTFRLDVQQAIKRLSFSPFRLSFAGQVTGYVNGRRTGGEGSGGRAFLALRTSAGTSQMLRDAVHPELAKLHLPLYHDNPEFHASFAWCLVKPGAGLTREHSLPEEEEGDDVLESGDKTPFAPAVLSDLTSRFASAILQAQPKDGWLIDGVQLKIAKDIYTIPFA